MAIGDHFRLKLSGNYLGQTINNIFWFENSVANLSAEDVWDMFLAQILPRILLVVTTAMTYTDVEVVNVEDPGDFYTDGFSFDGSRSAADNAPPFTAWSFQLNPNRVDRKAGAKRFAGLNEGDIVNGVNVGGLQSLLDDIALALGNAHNWAGGRLIPCVFSHRCVKDAITHRCTSTFVDSFSRITSAVYDGVSTQNSRKFGVGV